MLEISSFDRPLRKTLGGLKERPTWILRKNIQSYNLKRFQFVTSSNMFGCFTTFFSTLTITPLHVTFHVPSRISRPPVLRSRPSAAPAGPAAPWRPPRPSAAAAGLPAAPTPKTPALCPPTRCPARPGRKDAKGLEMEIWKLNIWVKKNGHMRCLESWDVWY